MAALVCSPALTSPLNSQVTNYGWSTRLDGAGLDALLAHVQHLSGERFADDVAVMLVRHHPDRSDQGGS